MESHPRLAYSPVRHRVGGVIGSRSICARGKQQVQPERCPHCLLQTQQPSRTPSVCLQSVEEIKNNMFYLLLSLFFLNAFKHPISDSASMQPLIHKGQNWVFCMWKLWVGSTEFGREQLLKGRCSSWQHDNINWMPFRRSGKFDLTLLYRLNSKGNHVPAESHEKKRNCTIGPSGTVDFRLNITPANKGFMTQW